MKLSAVHLLVGAALLGALVLSYLKSSQVVSAEHEKFVQSLLRLQQLDATLSQDLLKARFRLLDDYDDFPNQINDLKQAANALNSVPSFVPAAGREFITGKVDELTGLLSRKEVLLENFKSQNAVLNNSLRYLPVVGAELIRRLPAGNEDRELETLLNDLLRQVLAYSLDLDQDEVPVARQLLERLEEWRTRHAAHPEAAAVAGLALHVRSIVTRLPEVESITGQLMSLPTGPPVEELLHLYEGHFTAAMKTTERYRTVLLLLCALLVAGIGYTIYALDSANTHLDQRVRERTVELQQQIADRKRAEEAVREKEEFIRNVIDTDPNLIFVKDRDGRFVLVNRATAEFHGHTVEKLTGKLVAEINPDASAVAAFHRDDLKVMDTLQDDFVSEKMLVNHAGASVWIQMIKRPLISSDGKANHVLGVGTNITERRRAEMFLNSVLHSLPITVFIKEAKELRFVLWNKAGEELTGFSNAEMVGRNDYDFFPKEQADLFVTKDREALQGNKLVEIEEEIQTRHKGRRIVHTFKVPILDETGRPLYLLGICEDITLRKQAETDLAATHDKLMTASRQAGMAEVATGVLHNVGNVLNSVNISATLISDRVKKSLSSNLSRVSGVMQEHAADLGAFITTDPTGRKLPEYIAQLATRLTAEQAATLEEISVLQKNIGHIKEIVAMQQSYAKVTGLTEPVKVADLIEDALRMNEGTLKRPDMKIVREFAQHLPEIRVEKHKVLQILVNLLCNAKHACDDSGRKDKQLAVRVTRSDERVSIAVTDNGVGIPAENMIRIFNHGFTTRKEGHGFGLHTSALAAKEMGGALKVRSDGLGLGAEFTLELPLQTPTSTDRA